MQVGVLRENLGLDFPRRWDIYKAPQSTLAGRFGYVMLGCVFAVVEPLG